MRFDSVDGSKPTQSTVKTGTLATPPQQNPQRQGFRFDGWTCDGQPFDFLTPILQNTTLKAKWTKAADWTLSPDHGPATGARLTINPPSPQEPYYTSIQTAGEQTVGLTGDGRIYTWTQDSRPKQVPSPVQAPDGFHYQQAAAGSRRQAALGSDQQIYTWTSQQTEPATLDTSGNIQFTSISMNGDRLLAVDRQGRVHVLQADQTDSQNPNPKPTEQATTSLPGQAQAVLAVATGSRILVLDSDGQAWAWDASKTGNVKSELLRQDPVMRTVQAQALSQGFLLLNEDGQAYYLADSTTELTAVNLSEGIKASRVTADRNHAIITDRNGHVWSWKIDATPIRTDNSSQPYAQAVLAGDRINAISRRGGIYRWSPDKQGQPGKPVRFSTTTAPILETASLDGKALKLTKRNDAWQTDIPAHTPGQATIVITGKQGDQPFTRSLTYTVDQTLTRDVQQGSTYQVTFNTGGGSSEPDSQQVSYPLGRAQRPSPDPARKGYLFDGWFIGEVAYDFSKPVTNNITLTARWTPESQSNTWSISPDKGSQLGRESTTIIPPDSASRGIRFSQTIVSIGGAFSLAVGSDGNAYAWGSNRYGQLGDGTTTDRHTPVVVRKPADVPADFTYMQVSAAEDYSLAVGSDGYAYAWGRNQYGGIGNSSVPTGRNNSNAKSLVPVRVQGPSSSSKGLQAIQVSAGGFHSLALGSDGYTYAWGWNSYDQLGNNTTGGYLEPTSVPVRVRDPANPNDAGKGLQAVQVSGGYYHSLAVGSDGYTYAWGNNSYGELGNSSIPTGAANSRAMSPVPVRVRDPANPNDASKGLKARQVSAGSWHSLVLGSDGYAYAWGDNDNGQLGNNTKTDSPVPVRVRDPANPNDASKALKAVQVSTGWVHSLALGSDGYAYAWGNNSNGQLGNDTIPTGFTNAARSLVPVPVSFNLTLVITSVRFDTSPGTNLQYGIGSSVTVLTPAHAPGTVTVSVDYTIGGTLQTPDTSLQYTYTPATPAGVLPQAGGEGILLALATGMTGMGGVLASRRHRREQHQLSHASHE